MATSNNWRDVLKSQYEDLQRLEELDKELNTESLTANVDKLLQRPISASLRTSSAAAREGQKNTQRSDFLNDDVDPRPHSQVKPYPAATRTMGLQKIDFADEFDDLPPGFSFGSLEDAPTAAKASPNKAGVSIPLDLDDVNEGFGSLSRPQSARSAVGGLAHGAASPDLTRGVDSTGR